MRVRAYSSTANLGAGFDVLAVSHSLYYDVVEVCGEPCGAGGVSSVKVEGPYASESGNASSARAAVEEMLKGEGVRGVCLRMRVWKGVPPGRGLGSSGASAAAAVKAAYLLLKNAGVLGGVPSWRLVLYAGLGEAAAAGSPHYDNVAASLLGGVVVVARTAGGLRVRSFKPKRPLYLAFAVALKGYAGKTRAMRRVLPQTVPLGEAAGYAGRAAMLALALAEGDVEAAGELMMADTLVEPRRAHLLPCYKRVVEAALNAGAAGAALSGAGPSMVALCPTRRAAEKAAKAMAEAYSGCGEAMPAVSEVTQTPAEPV